MDNKAIQDPNEHAKNAWDANALFWDQRMGDGNDFVDYLLWPATERLLEVNTGETVLDIACGNGVFSRKMAQCGAKVTAFDFSEEMIAAAKSHESDNKSAITYKVVDATDQEALHVLGKKYFDKALCGMALFDMADIEPLIATLPKLLKDNGTFIFSLLHPCFNNSHMAQMAEMEDHDGDITIRHSVKVWGYMTPEVTRGVGIPGQPEAQLYFHRPLQMIFQMLFKNGFIVDGFEERAFPPDYEGGSFPLSWNGKFSEIPPVVVIRARLSA